MLKSNQDFSCLASYVPTNTENAYMVKLIKTMKQCIQLESIEKKCLLPNVVNFKKCVQRMLNTYILGIQTNKQTNMKLAFSVHGVTKSRTQLNNSNNMIV